VPSPHLTEVTPGVLVATSRFMATNTVVVTHGADALVIDPGVHLDELEALAAELTARRIRAIGGFATHAHWDHVLWHRELGDVPRWAAARTVTEAIIHHTELVEAAEAVTALDDARLGATLLAVTETVPWSGPEAQLVTHDAHAPGHTALHLPDLGLLVAGDMGSDIEVPLLEHGIPAPAALAAYHEGLERLAAVAPVDVVVTGHGHVCDGAMWRRRLDADRRYLDDLARGVERDDPRLIEPWLVDADASMGDELTKPAWRRWTRSLASPTAEQTAAVADGLVAFLGHRAGTVATYDALPGEVRLDGLLTASGALAADTGLPRPGRLAVDAVVAPRLGDDGSVTWHLDTGRSEVHRLGLTQPTEGAPAMEPGDIDVLLVPGRLFDRHGIRLGRGGGHYDRLLPRLRPGIPVIGVTTDDRIVARLPTEAHDQPMTHLATESGVCAVAR